MTIQEKNEERWAKAQPLLGTKPDLQIERDLGFSRGMIHLLRKKFEGGGNKPRKKRRVHRVINLSAPIHSVDNSEVLNLLSTAMNLLVLVEQKLGGSNEQ